MANYTDQQCINDFTELKEQILALLPKNTTTCMSRGMRTIPETDFPLTDVSPFPITRVSIPIWIFLLPKKELAVEMSVEECPISDSIAIMSTNTEYNTNLYHFGNDIDKAIALNIITPGWYFYDIETKEYEILSQSILDWYLDRL